MDSRDLGTTGLAVTRVVAGAARAPVPVARGVELLDEAVRVVPESLRSCTPLQVKATAGLRRLGTKEASDILAAVRQRLEEKYPFSLHGENAVEIMEGRDEGVYAWLTANYLLKTLEKGSSGARKTQPYAVLDLGGASTQIVFQPTFDMAKPDASLEDGEHKYELQFDGATRVLYQHSYLGYGLMTARQSVHRLVEFMGGLRGASHGKDSFVANPCLAKGTQKLVEIDDERMGGKFNVTMMGEDIGDFWRWSILVGPDVVCQLLGGGHFVGVL